VAVRVVDRLEVVDVDERNGQRPLVPVGPLDLVEELDEEGAAVRDAGQLVDGRSVSRLGERRRKAVDGAGEAGVDPAAGLRRGHGDAQLAVGELLDCLHDPAELDRVVREHDQRRQRHADGAGDDRGDA
jgi:hypothetical protein